MTMLHKLLLCHVILQNILLKTSFEFTLFLKNSSDYEKILRIYLIFYFILFWLAFRLLLNQLWQSFIITK